MNKKPLLPMKDNVVFPMFFADERDTESLTGFLQSVLKLSADEYEILEITDPHLLQEHKDDKLSIVDIKLKTKNDKIIHIEIQRKVPDTFRNRIMFYVCKLITEQLGGDKKRYEDVNKVISIVITDEVLIDECEKYHHHFTFCDPECENAVVLSDLVEVYTVELSKLPQNPDGTNLYDWASFIAAETEEELDMIAARNPEFGRTVIKLREMSASEKARAEYERRQKAERDFIMFVDAAEKKGRDEERQIIENNLKSMGLTPEQITEAMKRE